MPGLYEWLVGVADEQRPGAADRAGPASDL